MKKKLIKFTFCFVCLPLFLISCASKPGKSPEPSTDISAPELTDGSEGAKEDDGAAIEAESDSEEETAAETEDETEESEEAENTENEAEEEESEENAEESSLEEGDSETEETDEEGETEQSEDSLSEIEEPEVITVEYEEKEEPHEEAAEEISSEELDLDYIDVIDDDEDDEIRGSGIEIDVESEDQGQENNSDADETEAFEQTEAEDAEESENTEEAQEIIEASRKVSMKLQEYVDITYPGNGWVYMGLTDGSKDMTYFGRKLGTKDTKFTLQAKVAGTKYVHFYRGDPLTNEYIADFIEITISSEKGSNKTHITAPDYTPPLPKKVKKAVQSAPSVEKTEVEPVIQAEKKQEPTEQSAEKAVEKTAVQAEENNTKDETVNETTVENQIEKTKIDVKSLLKEAEVLYNNKDYSAADKKIKTFLEYAVTDRDSGLFLQGQILEAKSEIQDIKSAIEAYKTLTKNYPASPYWDKANKQIIYLNRFYLEIR